MRRNLYWLTAGLALGAMLGAGFILGTSAPGRAAHAALGDRQDPSDLLQTARELKAQRQHTLRRIADYLSDGNGARIPPDRLQEALELVGDLHMSDPAIVAAVAHHLHFMEPNDGVKPVLVASDPLQDFPALGALAKIGLPAIPVLVDEIRTEEDDSKRQRCARFLTWILGKHAQSWLSDALKRERSQESTARLEAALQHGGFTGPGAYGRHVWFFRPVDQAEPWYYRPPGT